MLVEGKLTYGKPQRKRLLEEIEGSVLVYQHCIGCKRLLEEIEANWYSERIYQDIQFFDAGYQEHLKGR